MATETDILAILNDATSASESLETLVEWVTPRGLHPEATEEEHATYNAIRAVLDRWPGGRIGVQVALLDALVALRDLESACIQARLERSTTT